MPVWRRRHPLILEAVEVACATVSELARESAMTARCPHIHPSTHALIRTSAMFSVKARPDFITKEDGSSERPSLGPCWMGLCIRPDHRHLEGC